MQKRVALSVVIPAYNEKDNVFPVLERTIETLSCDGRIETYELLLVNDGSTDGTGDVMNELNDQYDFIKVFHHAHNQGLGSALRTGYQNAVGDYVSFISADGDIGIDQVLNLYQDMDDADLMMSRRERDAPLHRGILSGGFRLISVCLFGFDSTQSVGIYVIRNSVLSKLSLRSDTGVLNILEVPVRCMALGCSIKTGIMVTRQRLSGESKVTNLPTVLKVLWEMFTFRLLLTREKWGRNG